MCITVDRQQRRGRNRRRRSGTWLTLAIVVGGGSGLAPAATIVDPGHGPVTLDAGGTGAVELGGITWAGGDAWLVVSDDTTAGPRAFTATIELDLAAGTVVGSPSALASLPLAAGGDPEGIALDPSGLTVVVADEVGPALRRFDATTGALVASAAMPSVFTAGLRSNLGFEGMGLGPRLANGDQSLLLVVDDAGIGGGAQALYPLIVILPPLFEDDFESGDLAAWSSTVP